MMLIPRIGDAQNAAHEPPINVHLQIGRMGVRVGSFAAQTGVCRDQALPETFLCASTPLQRLHSACRGPRETGILSCQQVI